MNNRVELARQATLASFRKQKDSDHSVTCRFEDLEFIVKGKDGNPLALLGGITGKFEPGCVTAIFGPSGCGKLQIMFQLVHYHRNSGRFSPLVTAQRELKEMELFFIAA
jgi:ABC-type transport system involved in cytochrome bd biosynthesis fused ATPase/permease subunit